MPYSISVDEPKAVEYRYGCGGVAHTYVNLTINVKGGSHSFRVDRFLHNDGNKRPLILLNNIHPADNSPYFAKEELCEYPEITTTNPLELAEFEAAKRRMSLGATLSMMPVLGIALSFFIGVMIGISGAF